MHAAVLLEKLAACDWQAQATEPWYNTLQAVRDARVFMRSNIVACHAAGMLNCHCC